MGTTAPASARTHVALLRGVNLGPHNRISMPVLREAVASLGHTEVVTYIQSGNVAFRAARPGGTNTTLASAIGAVIAERTGVSPSAVVLGASELDDAVRDNPFPTTPEHRLLHAVFLPRSPDAEGVASVAAAVERARAKSSRDDARVVGRVLYLSTPDGFARSVLRSELDRDGANRTPMREGTARNWGTVLALHTLVER